MTQVITNDAVTIDDTYHAAAARLWPHIAQAQRIICPFHINADPDAVGSALGMAQLLRDLGKEVLVYASDGQFPQITAFLPGADAIIRYAGGPLPAADLILAIDSADTGRLGELYTQNSARFAAGPTVMIDHHMTHNLFGVTAEGAAPNFIDSTAAACAEMVYLLARAWGLSISPATATCLIAGIYGDTLSLQTSSTTPRVALVVGDLLAAGADLMSVVNNFYRSRPFVTTKIWGAVLSQATWCGHVLWSQITPAMLAACGATDGEGGGVINFLTGTQGATVTVLLHQREDGWRAGLRTLNDAVNVAAIAEQFGGGGHRKASGCAFPGDEAARDHFLTEVNRLAAAQIAAASHG